jgi:hypothetical protein
MKKKLEELRLAPGEVLFLDRIEDGVATLVIGANGDREESLPVDRLPPDAREGQRLRVREDGQLEWDHAATDEDRQQVEDLMAELLANPPKEA